MKLTALDDIKKYTSFIIYKKVKSNLLDNPVKVYVCKPYKAKRKVIKEIWTGYITYVTNATSKQVGKYIFILDKENDATYNKKISESPIWVKMSPFPVNTLIAQVKYDEEKIFTDDKLIYTCEDELIEYLNENEGICLFRFLHFFIILNPCMYAIYEE